MTKMLADSRWNLGILLVQGLFTSVRKRLAPPRVIIPYIYIAAGGPTFFAGILVPVVYGAAQLTQMFSAPVIASARLRKTYMAVGIVIVLCGMALTAFAIHQEWVEVLIGLFLAAAVLIGVGQGIGLLAYGAMLPDLLDKEKRSLLFTLEGGISAFAVIGIALATHWYFQGRDPLDSHIALVWLAVLCGVIATVTVVFVREQPKRPDSEQGATARGTSAEPGVLSQIRIGWSLSLTHGWFRHYLIAQILLLSITQVMPFYAIHAASLHGNTAGALSSVVIALSVGAILSGPILFLLAKRSIHMQMALGVGTGALSAAIALFVDSDPRFQHFIFYAPVFILLSFSTQVVAINLRVYLGEMAPREGREYFFSASKMLTGTFGIAVALVLGFLAHYKHEGYPIAVILVMNVLALTYLLAFLPPLAAPAAKNTG